jgi:RNA 2',3'-cyclic 3'-phosphodiesterase
MSGRWRLFVAVELPEDARAAIVRAVGTLPPLPAFRLVGIDQLHLTILFLGAVEPDLLDTVEERLEGVAAGLVPFRTGLTSLGTFPPKGKARVLWVGLRDDDGHLVHIATATKDALRDLVITEDRPFRAHVTVARAREPVRLPAAARAIVVEPVSFDVGTTTLFRSHLGGGAPARYEALARWHLGSPTP